MEMIPDEFRYSQSFADKFWAKAIEGIESINDQSGHITANSPSPPRVEPKSKCDEDERLMDEAIDGEAQP